MSESAIRIVHVVGNLNRGGIETLLVNLYRKIDRSKIQFDFIKHTEETADYDEEVRSLGGRIFSVPSYRGKNHFEYKKSWKTLLSEHPEWRVIHGHVRSTAAIYLTIAHKLSLVTIAHSHSTGNGTGFQAMVKNIMQRMSKADYYFACSHLAGEWMFGERICRSKNFFVFNNAIYVNEFTFNEERRRRSREELDIERNFVIGNVGRLNEPKNHRFLINVFTKVCEYTDEARLLVVGDGTLRKELENLTVSLGIREKVLFVGSTSDIPSMLLAMDLFVFPSVWEGFGMALIEAQASGLQCIVSEAIQREAVITDGVTTLSIASGEKVWSEHIHKYILEPKQRNRNAIDEVKKAGFDILEQAEWLQKFYMKL